MSAVDEYNLRFAQKPVSFDANLTLYRNRLPGSSPLQVYAVQSGGLGSYQYNNDSWIKHLSMKNFTARQLYFDVLSNMLIAKTQKGISFYQHKDNEFNLLFKSEDFEKNLFNDDYFGWNKPGSVLKFGHFYHDLNLLGILTHRRKYGIKLFAVMNDSLENGEYPIFGLDTNLNILGNCSEAELELFDLKQNGQENIIVHGQNGLNIYLLNQKNWLEHLMQVPNSAKPNGSEVKLFFPNLTGQPYRDIVSLSSSGMFLYQYSVEKSNYGLIDHQPMFAKLRGWRKDHTDSVQFEDIDLDGRQEMLFTGPQGINLLSFNNKTKQWKSLLDNSQLSISERHSAVMVVLPAQNPIIFTKYKNQVHWANIVEVPEVSKEEHEPSKTSFDELPSPVIPTFNFEETIYTTLLRDQLDCTSIIGAVDSSTGRPRFRLPLVDLSRSSSDLKFDLFYDGNSQTSDSLGVGWSWPKNVIQMDDQSSVFPEDVKYYIILQDMPLQLTFDSRNSTDNVHSYKISNEQSDSRIYYHTNKEMWELDIDGVMRIYGRAQDDGNDSIGWGLKWKNWRGVGSSTTGQDQFANAWYLSEVKDKNDNVLRYIYDAVTVSATGGKSFTREISLKSINDSQGNKIIFNYAEKNKSEYESPDIVDQKGNLNTQMVQSRYLAGYSVTTPSYRQVINFIYELRDGKRLLTKIAQKEDITSKPILVISYKKISKSSILESVLLPTGASVQFDFKLLGNVSSINEERGQRYNVGANHRVDYGGDFVLVSYIDRQGQVVLRMFNQDLTSELYSSLAWKYSSSLPLLGRNTVQSYGVFLAEDFIAVVLFYKADQDLYLLRKDEDMWVKTIYTFGKKAKINFGNNFMVVQDNTSAIEVISWNKDSKKWIKDKPFSKSSTDKDTFLLTIFGRGIIFYDDNQLSLRYKDSEDRWKYKTIAKIPGVIKGIRETLNKFALSDKPHNAIFGIFKETALQISNNLLLLNRWKTDGMKLYSVMDLFVLDSSYQVAQHNQQQILQDDLNQPSEWLSNNNGSSFKVAYEIDKGKFKVIVKDFRGVILDDIHKNSAANSSQRIERKNAIIKEYTKILEDPSKKSFFLNPHKYVARLNVQVVVCNNKTFTFTGDGWKEDTKASETESKAEKWSEQLGDKFVLRQKDVGSSIKLYTQFNEEEKLVLDLGVKQLNQTLVRYPIFLAHQETGRQVSVVEFEPDGCSTYKLPWEEKVSSFSSYEMLVTSVDDFVGNSKTLVFRQQLSVRRLLPNPVVTKVIVSLDDGTKRVTGYDYGQSKASGNIVYYENTSIVPGNDKRSFGWLEEFKDLGNLSNTEKKIFNSKGVLIKTLKFEEGQSETAENKNVYLNTTLFDKTGRLKIIHFFPIEVADQEVGYYGFEDYEINRIGEKDSTSEKKWVFDEKDIVKDGFSLTGRNYLSLSGKTLVGTFTPTDQNQQYVASCWMRPQSKMFEINDVVPYLKVVVSTEGRTETFLPLGEVKFQSSSWFYLEAIVDLLYAKAIYDNLNEVQKNGTLLQQEDINLTISIVIAPGTNTTIDVDHVRFSPLRNNFKANVFDSKTKQVKEVISANGLIERKIYDKYQKQVASVNEYGEIRDFITYTKASSIGRMTEIKSTVLIQAESGFHEDFAPFAFHGCWKIDSADAWRNSQGQLQHLTNESHTLQLNLHDISRTSFGLRLYFSLQSGSVVINFDNTLKVIRSGNTAKIFYSGEEGQSIPLDGELLIVVEGSRVFVWVDGGLYIDGSCNSSIFNIEISGRAKIGDLIVFSRPSVQITYRNALDEILQEIILEDESTAIVTQFLYDELGRKTVTTLPARVGRFKRPSLLAYYPKFVINSNPDGANSVWKTGKLQGEAIQVIGEYDNSQVSYCDNPLKEECAIGLPGKEFSVSGPFAKRFSSSSDDLFIKNNFPTSQNYTYRIEHKPGNVEDISVFDTKDRRVAWYVRVPRRKDLLSTYEYDENGKLLLSLSPIYHERAGTFYKQYSQLISTSSEEKILQKTLGVNISYDAKGNIITKTTPDSGKIENLYDKNGLLSFILHYSGAKIENIVYFDYDELGRLSSTGQVNSPTSKEELLTLGLSANNTKVYQKFHYSDSERHPLLRGLAMRTITYNDDEPLIEESILNVYEENLSKRIIIPTEDSENPVLIGVNKEYVGGRLREMEYPIDIQGVTLRVTYQYDKLGTITGVGVPGEENLFASFTYNANGHVTSEVHLPDSAKNFTRKYGYNSAGFITSLKDNFLSEKVYYTDAGYGGYGYGDGTITRTEFEANWHEHCDNSKLGLNERSFVNRDTTPEESATCFHELKKAGYINDRGHQEKVYYSALEHELPIICSYGVIGRHIQSTLGKEGFPVQYGHSYDYGNYQELTKAKYFVGREMPAPLQPDSFANKISGTNKKSSRAIFEKLKNSEYMIQDNAKSDASLAHSKRGKSVIRPSLSSDLRNVNADYERFRLPLERLLIKCFSQNHDLQTMKVILKDAFLRWSRNQEVAQRSAIEILKMLETNGYLKNPLAKEFSDALTGYQPFIHDVVRVLSEHFAKNLGESEFDVESYSIDANGNHKHFYTGFDRYQISYHNNTNQVSSLRFQSFSSSGEEQQFLIKHDSRGNIIQAMHKGIERIDYHPVSNRATKIRLTDGRTLTFKYDAQGERILKRVSDSTGQTTKEIHYIRDESGRALVERQIMYIAGGVRSDVSATAYIYGPRGLLGFIRGNSFYSVITDHEGSIRLVVKGDEVVAAYDYLPYGNLMREYGSDPNGQISYRYTGQELDEEIGLYNFHARFYDPSIGRFYQLDPKEQYFSPYKYAGNSPVSIIDPNGEFAFLIPLIIAAVLAGAYLGGAAANKNWDLTQWKMNTATWLAILGGGVAGGLLPVGFVGSVGAMTAVGISQTTAIAITTGLGVGATYLSVASNSNEWNPAKWEWTSPEIYNAAFQGFAAGSSLPGGFAGYKLAMNKLSLVGKGFFVVGTGSISVGSFVWNGFRNDWNSTKPGMYFGILQAFDDATNLPVFMGSVFKSARRSIKGINRGSYKHLGQTRRISGYRDASHAVVVMTLKGLGVTVPAVGLTYLNEGLDMSNPNTYFDLLRQMAMVNQYGMMGKAFLGKRKATKALHKSEKVKNLTKKIAEDAINWSESYGMLTDKESIKNKARTAKENARKEARRAIEDARKEARIAIDDARKEAEIAKGDAKKAFEKERAKKVEAAAKEKSKIAIAMANEKAEIRIATLMERAEMARADARKELVMETEGRKEADEIAYINAKEKAEIARAVANAKSEIARANARKELDKALDGRKESVDINKAFMKERAEIEAANAIEREEIMKANAQEIEEIEKGGKNFGQTAVTVGMDNSHAFVAFSGNKGKNGFVLVYNHEELANPKRVNDKIINEIEINRKVLISKNIESLFGSASKEESLRQLLGEKLSEVQKDSVIRELKENVNIDGNLSEDRIILAIKKSFSAENGRLSMLQNELSEIKKKRVNSRKELKKISSENQRNIEDWMKVVGTNVKNMEHFMLVEKIHFEWKSMKDLKKIRIDEEHSIIQFMEKLDKQEKSLLDSIKKVELEINDIARVPWEAIKSSFERLPSWELTNCAEPHVITVFSRANDLFGIKTQESIKYLATYTTKGLNDFPACLQCKSTTQYIKNIVTEPWWQDIIDALKEQASNSMLDRFKDRAHFLLPKTNGSLKAKEKRSVFVVQSNVETKPNSATLAGKGKLISMQSGKQNCIDSRNEATSSATRSSPFVYNCFSWAMKTAESVKGFIVGWLPDNIGDFKSANGERNMDFMGMTAIEANGTILLLDTLIRRATGQKNVCSNVRSITEQETFGYAINITEGFEKIIEQTAEIYRISTNGLNIDFPKVQGEVSKRIRSGKYCEILGVLSASAHKAFYDSEDAGLRAERLNKVMNIVDKNLVILMNQSISRILSGTDNILEIKEQHSHLANMHDLNNVSLLCHSSPPAKRVKIMF